MLRDLLIVFMIFGVIVAIVALGASSVSRNVAQTQSAAAQVEAARQTGETERAVAHEAAATQRQQSFEVTMASLVAMVVAKDGFSNLLSAVGIGIGAYALALSRRGEA